MPPASEVDHVEEPFVKARIVAPAEYIGPIMTLANERRGVYKNMSYIDTQRVEFDFEFPLAEIILDFYDRLKTISRGYASLDYEMLEYRESDLVKLDMLINGDPVDAFSVIIHRDKAYDWGRKIADKLKELIPRQLFEVIIQAAIGTKVIARTTVRPLRKNVLAKCYGGDITRKRKLLEKQKEGKRRMKQVGTRRDPPGGVPRRPAGGLTAQRVKRGPSGQFSPFSSPALRLSTRPNGARPRTPSFSLVIQTSFLGDVILTTPLLAALARRGPVDVVTTPAAAAILANHPAVHSVIPYDKRGDAAGLPGLWRLARTLRKRYLARHRRHDRW